MRVVTVVHDIQFRRQLNTQDFRHSLYILCLSVCLFVCLFVSNKRQRNRRETVLHLFKNIQNRLLYTRYLYIRQIFHISYGRANRVSYISLLFLTPWTEPIEPNFFLWERLMANQNLKSLPVKK